MTPADIARTIVERIKHSVCDETDFGFQWRSLGSGTQQKYADEWIALAIPVIEEAMHSPTCAAKDVAERGLWAEAFASLERRAQAAEKERDELRAVISSCHLALGEDTASDDATIPDGIGLWVQAAKAKAAEVRAAHEEIRALKADRDELQREYDDAENSAIAVIGDLRAEVERLRSAPVRMEAQALMRALLERDLELAESRRMYSECVEVNARIQVEEERHAEALRRAHDAEKVIANFHEIRAEDVRQIRALMAEVEERQQSFDLRWKADMRAIERWHDASNPPLVWPDHVDLCVWLLGENERISQRVRELEAREEEAKVALDIAWGVIANASGGDWSKETKEWRECAAFWRDHHWLKCPPSTPKPPEPAPPTPTQREHAEFVSIRGIAPDLPASPLKPTRSVCGEPVKIPICAVHRYGDHKSPVMAAPVKPKEPERCPVVDTSECDLPKCGNPLPCPKHGEEGRS